MTKWKVEFRICIKIDSELHFLRENGRFSLKNQKNCKIGSMMMKNT